MRSNDRESRKVRRIQIDQAVVFLVVRVPMVPTKSQSDRKPGSHFPRIVDVKAEFLLPEVGKAAVVLVAQVGRQAQQEAAETRAREGRGCLRRGIVQLRPIPVKTVGAFRLLQLFDVVVFLTSFESELDGVPA